MNTKRRTGIDAKRERTGRWLPGLAIGAGALCLCASTVDDGVIDGARAALEKWVEARRTISQEQRDWALGREMLESRIALVQRELDSLNAKQAETEASIAEADKKRADLVAQNENAKQGSAALTEAVLALETRTKELLARLPDPIRERVKPLSQRFPADSQRTTLSLGGRFQNVVGVLNEVDKFHREITVTSEVRSLGEGTSAEVTALYVGIGQAYYVGAQGSVACVGSTSPEGFAWRSANDAAASIARAIAILENESPAEFVPLPVSIQ